MCDVTLRPIAVKVVGGVPAENQAEVVSNAVAGRVGQPRLCTVSTQTDNADGESVRWSDYDKDQDFYFQDLEEDGDSVQLDFAPYGGLRWQRQYEAADRRYDSQPDDYRCQLFLDQFADAVAAVVESDVDDASTNSSHVEYEVRHVIVSLLWLLHPPRRLCNARRLSVCLYVCLFVSQSVCLCVCRSVCLSVCLSVSNFTFKNYWY